MEFIFGLDMLRKHQCGIDLKENSLRFGSADIAVPFLPEHEIPRYLREDEGSDSPAGTPAIPLGITDAPSTSAGPSGGASGPVAVSPAPLVVSYSDFGSRNFCGVRLEIEVRTQRARQVEPRVGLCSSSF